MKKKAPKPMKAMMKGGKKKSGKPMPKAAPKKGLRPFVPM